MARRRIDALFVSLPLEGRSDVPLHRQLYERLREAILSGHLHTGARLPSTRSLARRPSRLVFTFPRRVWASPGGASLAAMPSRRRSVCSEPIMRSRSMGSGRLTRTDATVNFAWGSASPFAVPQRPAEIALQVEFPAGTYRAEWVNPLDGTVAKAETFSHAGGARKLVAPAYEVDIALRVKRVAHP